MDFHSFMKATSWILRKNTLQFDSIESKQSPIASKVEILSERMHLLFYLLYLISIFLANSEIQWLQWSNWSECDKSCGSGIRVRTRSCSSRYNNDSSKLCSLLGDKSSQIQSCQNPECKRMEYRNFISIVVF